MHATFYLLLIDIIYSAIALTNMAQLHRAFAANSFST